MIGGILLLGLTIFLSYFFHYHLDVKKRTSTGMIEVKGFVGYMLRNLVTFFVYVLIGSMFLFSMYLIIMGMSD